MDNVNVFAYGSNMSTQRMRDRVPSATVITTGYVMQRRLAFHKRSEDGSAKADAAFSSRRSQRVWGVVYQLPRREKAQLDAFEYLGVGYDQHRVHGPIGGMHQISSFGMYDFGLSRQALNLLGR